MVDDLTEVKFNIGTVQLMIIGNALQNSKNAYLRGDLIKWYHNMRVIKQTMISRLSPSDRKKLKAIENMINKYKQQVNKNKMGLMIELYDTTVQCLMDEKGFLVPLKENRTDLFGNK